MSREGDVSLESILSTYGPYPLHKAAELGHLEALRTLLQQGFSPNETNYDCLTPLHEACGHGHADCAQLLISYGSKVDAQSIDGGTPLCDACASNSPECVRLLLRHNARVNPPLVLSTPLHEAALSGSGECVCLLINTGARLDAMDCNYGTPLHAATFMRNSHCVKLLLKAGALVNAAKTHQTALHLAASNDDLKTAQVLLEFGANVFASNNQNKRPKDLLPKQDGLLFDTLLKYEESPPCLQDLCRRCIRAQLGSKRLCLLENLQLPSFLADYLCYSR